MTKDCAAIFDLGGVVIDWNHVTYRKLFNAMNGDGILPRCRLYIVVERAAKMPGDRLLMVAVLLNDFIQTRQS